MLVNGTRRERGCRERFAVMITTRAQSDERILSSKVKSLTKGSSALLIYMISANPVERTLAIPAAPDRLPVAAQAIGRRPGRRPVAALVAAPVTALVAAPVALSGRRAGLAPLVVAVTQHLISIKHLR